MKQTELDKLFAGPYAEFERRVRRARQRAAGLTGVDAFHAAPAEGEARVKPGAAAAPPRIEELVA